jgi:probable HAF family extracellular repeat protein
MRHSTRGLTATLVAFCFVMAGIRNVAAQNPGSIIDLGTLGGTSTTPIGMNDLGDVVGSSSVAGHTASNAFLWSGGVMHDLGRLAGHVSSQARGVNNLRQVVGISFPPGFSGLFNSHAFLWENGVMTDLNTPATAAAGWLLTQGWDINDAGQIVGAGFRNGVALPRAILIENGVVTDLGTLGGPNATATSINRFGQIAGLAAASDTFTHAVTWTNGVIKDLGGTLGNFVNLAYGLNDLGEAAGSWSTPSGGLPMFWDASGAPVMLPLLDSVGNAYHINNLRQIAGAGHAAAGAAQRAVLWQDGAIVDLETLIPTGHELMGAYSINNAGQVVGQWMSGRGFLIQLPVSASGVGTLVESLVGDPQLEASLLAKINDAIGTPIAECNVLRAVANQIRAQSGKKIPADIAAELLENIQTATVACQ